VHKDLYEQALEYHENPTPGKIGVKLTKPAASAYDLSLAYSPGVAAPVKEIAANPENAYRYTNKGNLVAVISNGTAILGLGNLGALASKPVMEGKALLFKKFANLDSIDIEIDTKGNQEFIDTVKRISCSFGGINLEDIKAPECFAIEKQLIEECDIPVFHDDQHGTAVVTAAGFLNALEVANKKIENVRLVCLGAGSAAIACIKILFQYGLKKDNLVMLDSKGVISTARTDINHYKAEFALDTNWKTLDDAIDGADAFLGVSGGNLLSAEQVKKMALNPIIFACANPEPEIRPETALAVRPDAIIATGRSDYPNQVNNVLCFPYIFRGALDARASCINDAMKIAAIEAIRSIAKLEVIQEVKDMYNGEDFSFGSNYIIPKPGDPRLLDIVAPAVAKAAIDSNVSKLYPQN
jgi:malate dehydrogenase (oxaloacetate-decarboxylating)(NADP+)